jgi:hypothetical protein
MPEMLSRIRNKLIIQRNRENDHIEEISEWDFFRFIEEENISGSLETRNRSIIEVAINFRREITVLRKDTSLKCRA